MNNEQGGPATMIPPALILMPSCKRFMKPPSLHGGLHHLVAEAAHVGRYLGSCDFADQLLHRRGPEHSTTGRLLNDPLHPSFRHQLAT